ncbi:zinc c6 transcription factor [Ophiostoma piceae UAMH 11346]|uniref:Zinc c6 transcription factor n=1 Tax=Ophiostoma piceae (strain UAMH 11346) TaxID=1262450 RepID=S3BT93_OPHP1|nr:zinc c6 transcription factor [Ophiostoma piceae UAMH 11346]
MPSTKVTPAERRRCPQACGSCKRRKERCDGRHPCSRCIVRGVQYECFFSRPLETLTATGVPSTTPAVAMGPSTSAVPTSAASPLSTSSVAGSAGGSAPHAVASLSSTSLSLSSTSGSGSGPASLPKSTSSSARTNTVASPSRNGRAPVSASTANTVRHDRSIDFDDPAGGVRANAANARAAQGHDQPQQQPRRKRRRSNTFGSSSSAAPVPHLSRLIQGGRGSLFYIGDSANLCFLQIIRRLIRDSLGSCTFTDDPLQHILVEAAPNGRNNWIVTAIQGPPQIPTAEQATGLLKWFLRATNCVLAMYDERELEENMLWWLQQQPPRDSSSPENTRDSFTSADSAAQEAIFFLIFAIGAQTHPDDWDEKAEKYFNYGRYLTVCGATVEPSIATIQAYILLTMYLLGASRRNAAFMYLGIAVRAAYALGIHRSDINAAFEPNEYVPRERLWKVLRILDLFLSTSLGRPPSTTETRDTKSENNYSASNDLCAIFEAILTQVYSTRNVSTATIEKISEQHRRWTARFASGLATDGIHSEEYLGSDRDGKRSPNIGLFHLKEAYYWTIMLLSRPFLIENISQHIARSKIQTHAEGDVNPPSPSDDILAYACVDSAIRTMSLLRGLLTAHKVPKRLPFIVNSAFVSALVLGFAQFGDLDRTFPISKSLAIAQKVLALFGRHDAVSKRYASIVTDLQVACEMYTEKRARGKMERHSVLIGGLFGTVEDGKSRAVPASMNRPSAADGAHTKTGLSTMATPSNPDLHPHPPNINHVLHEPEDQASAVDYSTEPTTQDGAARNPLAIAPPPLPPSEHDLHAAASSMLHQRQSYPGIDLTPPSTDDPDDFLGVGHASTTDDSSLMMHHNALDGQHQHQHQHQQQQQQQQQQNNGSGFDLDDASQQLLPHMTGLPDMIMAMSPRMLSFDSFDKSLQLFPTMDTTGLF